MKFVVSLSSWNDWNSSQKNQQQHRKKNFRHCEILWNIELNDKVALKFRTHNMFLLCTHHLNKTNDRNKIKRTVFSATKQCVIWKWIGLWIHYSISGAINKKGILTLFRWFGLHIILFFYLIYGDFFCISVVRMGKSEDVPKIQIGESENYTKKFPWQTFSSEMNEKEKKNMQSQKIERNSFLLGRPWRKCESFNPTSLFSWLYIY